MTDDASGSADDASRGADDGPPAEPPADRLDRLHAHLAATAELPIDRETNRWLGEAEAVARDAATADLDAPTVTKRVRQVRDLLAEAGEAGHGEADAHLEAARELCETILADAD